MKKSLLIAMLTFTSFNAFSSTLVKCVVINPRNVLVLDIDQSHLKGTLTELNGQTAAIESTNGSTFNGADFFGEITLAPGVYTSPTAKTHAVLTDINGNKQILNCIKRNLPIAFLDNTANITQSDMSQCRVTIPRTGNPHRDYDNKFRACRAKAISLNLDPDQSRACSAICMKS